MPYAITSTQSHVAADSARMDPTAHSHTSDAQGHAPDQSAASRPLRLKKRNKPTLSCSECVERKTKCDRLRPTCVACARRQSTCRYFTPPKAVRSAPMARVERSNSTITNTPSPYDINTSPESPNETTAARPPRRPSLVEQQRPTQIDVIAMASQHPFHNYWTRTGGLPEVIGVLPTKEHADVLVSKYFDVIDPLYPIVLRSQFIAEYEEFWKLSAEEKCKSDPATLALHFVIYAMGTQVMYMLDTIRRCETAEFYISASHQALSLSSYLNRFTLSTLQTMVLTCYFLISSNRVSDAWTFSGIIQRQASVLGLNRDPDIVVPEVSFQEKQQRCKLWQAIMFQDTGLSLYLKLPPTSLHWDVTPDMLKYPTENPDEFIGIPRTSSPGEASPINDVAYLRSMWQYTAFIQTHVCIPMALSRPKFKDRDVKNRLINQYREMHRSWSFPFSSCDPSRYSISDKRLARQLITISSNYFYVLMELFADENEEFGVTCDVFGALEAAHQGLSGFFALARLFPGEVDIWLAYHTRAFVKATKVANILAAQSRSIGPPDPRFVSAMDDLDRYLHILSRASGLPEYERLQKSRATTLQSIRNSIVVI